MCRNSGFIQFIEKHSKISSGYVRYSYLTSTAATLELSITCIFLKIKAVASSALENVVAEVGRENIFKLTIGNESLHQDSNDNGVRIANFATSKNLVVKSTMFHHRNIHTYTWTSPDGKTHNQTDHILIDRRWHLSTLNV